MRCSEGRSDLQKYIKNISKYYIFETLNKNSHWIVEVQEGGSVKQSIVCMATEANDAYVAKF